MDAACGTCGACRVGWPVTGRRSGAFALAPTFAFALTFALAACVPQPRQTPPPQQPYVQHPGPPQYIPMVPVIPVVPVMPVAQYPAALPNVSPQALARGIHSC